MIPNIRLSTRWSKITTCVVSNNSDHTCYCCCVLDHFRTTKITSIYESVIERRVGIHRKQKNNKQQEIRHHRHHRSPSFSPAVIQLWNHYSKLEIVDDDGNHTSGVVAGPPARSGWWWHGGYSSSCFSNCLFYFTNINSGLQRFWWRWLGTVWSIMSSVMMGPFKINIYVVLGRKSTYISSVVWVNFQLVPGTDHIPGNVWSDMLVVQPSSRPIQISEYVYMRVFMVMVHPKIAICLIYVHVENPAQLLADHKHS